jgi:hypothetical protein
VESPGRRSGCRIAPLEKVGRRRRSHAHHDEPDLGGGGSTLKTARPGQGEPNLAMEATDPITKRRIWGRTGAWDPAVLLLKSDGQTLHPCSKPSRRRTTRTGGPASRESRRQAPAPQPAKAASQAPPPPPTAVAGTLRPQGAYPDPRPWIRPPQGRIRMRPAGDDCRHHG